MCVDVINLYKALPPLELPTCLPKSCCNSLNEVGIDEPGTVEFTTFVPKF